MAEENQNAAISKDLSDIKSSLAVNTNETANIKSAVGEIKSDIKELKDNTSHRVDLLEGEKASKDEVHRMKAEADDIHADHEERIRGIEGRVWKAIGALAILQIIILPVVLYLFFKLLSKT